MRNLLSTGFSRLWRDKVFWICALGMLALSTIAMLSGAQQAVAMINEGFVRTLDDYYFSMVPYIGLVCAVFTGLFIGTEYSEGTLRNKIIAGRTRTAVYLSNFILCLAAGACFNLAWLLGGLVGIPIIGLWGIGIPGLLIYALVAFFITAALVGIFALLCMLSSNKAISVVIAVLLALGLLIFAAIAYGVLNEPEFYSGLVVTVDGLQMAEPSPNPAYVSGILRSFYQFLMDCLPIGQGILMANLELGSPLLSILYSVGIVLITTLAGLTVFQQKDIR